MQNIKTNFIHGIKGYSLIEPQKVALRYKESSISYSEYVRIYSDISDFFMKIMNPWNRVGVLFDDDLSGALTALPVIDHAVLIQLDPSISGSKLLEIMALLKIDYIITDATQFTDKVSIVDAGIGIIEVDFSETYELRGIKLMSSPKDEFKLRNEKWDDLVSIRTTSGTTSIPKIVPITGKMFMSSNQRHINTYKHNSDDVVLIPSRIFKSLSFSTVLITLTTGGTVILNRGFDPALFLNCIFEQGVTCFASPTAMLSSLIQYIENNNIKPANNKLRYARSSGAPLPFKLKTKLEEFLGLTFDQSYGMTETFNIAGTHDQPNGYREGSVGVPNGLEVKILNGEIMIRGESVFPGYLNDDVDNDEYFTDGWFHTGDLGEIDSDGYIYVRGRIKEMINRGGEKISPYEVEKTIMEHPEISQAVVFPYPNEYGSENAGAAVVMNNGNIDLEGLRAFLRGRITAYKMPTLLYQVDESPVGENAKVKRKELFEILKERYPKSTGSEADIRLSKLSETEKAIYKIWKKALRTNIRNKYATFSDLGGDSLNGAQVLSEIENKFNVKLPVDILYDEGTLEDIADYINQRTGKEIGFKFLTALRSSGSKKPLIFVHTVLGDATTYRHLGKAMELDRPVYALSFRNKGVDWPVPLDFDSIAKEYAKEIVKLDPAGPYYLCGHCWGGVLAFRLACELRSMNKEVAMLAMLDSPEKILTKKGKGRRISLRRRFFITIKEGLKELQRYDFKTAVKIMFVKIGNIPTLIKQVQSQKVYAFAVKHNIRPLLKISNKIGALGYAYSKYKPQKYDGRITYFKATQGRVSSNIDYKLWKEMAVDLKYIEIDCEHNDLIKRGYADKLALALRTEMEDAHA